jgi:hypothetical protein
VAEALGAVRVRGLRELNRALKRTDVATRQRIHAELADVAEPVRADAERLAVQEIRKIGPEWSRMRTGLSVNLVYVAPAKRSSRRRNRKRKNLAGLLMDRAMQPALEQNATQIERRLGQALDRGLGTFDD